LKINVAAPDPVSGMEKKSGSGMNVPDHLSDSLETGFTFTVGLKLKIPT
jgi:hypothetical protein